MNSALLSDMRSCPVEPRPLTGNVTISKIYLTPTPHQNNYGEWKTSGCFDGTNIWMPPMSNLFYWTFRDSVMDIYNVKTGHIQSETVSTKGMSFSFDGERIWESNTKYRNLNNGSSSNLNYTNGVNGNSNLPTNITKYTNRVVHRDAIYRFLNTRLVVMAVNTNTMTGLDYECMTTISGNRIAYDGISDLWYSTSNPDPVLIRLNLDTMEETVYTPPATAGTVYFVYGTIVWYASGTSVCRWDYEANTLQTFVFANGVNGNTNMGNLLSRVGPAFDGKYLWFAPSMGDRLFRLDPDTGSIQGITLTDVNYYGGESTVDRQITDIVFDGRNLWLIPGSSQGLFKVSTSETLYSITENHIREDGTVLRRPVTRWRSASEIYNRQARTIKNYRCVRYSVDNQAAQAGDTPYLDNITANHTITYIYDTEFPLTRLETQIVLRKNDAARMKVLHTGDDTTTAAFWNSSDESVVSVDDRGILVARSVGSATVTCADTSGAPLGRMHFRADDGINAPSFDIIAGGAILQSDFEPAITMKTDHTLQLVAYCVPANTTESLTWKTSNSAVATVDQKGLVTARTKGKAYITVTSNFTATESTICILVDALSEYNLSVTGRWTANVTTQPSGQFNMTEAAFVIDNKAYVMGTDVLQTSLVDIYDIETNTWASGENRPVALLGAAWGKVGTKIYSAGGCPLSSQTGDTDRLYIYDTETDQWKQGSSMPTIENWGSGFTAYGKFHALFSGKHYVYDPDTGLWAEAAAPPEKNLTLGMAGKRIGSKYYLFWQEEKTVYEYDILTDTWREAYDRSANTNNVSLTSLGTQMMCLGGGTLSSALRSVAVHHNVRNAWYALTQMPVARASFASATSGTDLYTFRSINTGQVDRFTIPDAFIITEEYRSLDNEELCPESETLVGLGQDYLFRPVEIPEYYYLGYMVDNDSLIRNDVALLEDIRREHAITYIYGDENPNPVPMIDIETVVAMDAGDTAQMTALTDSGNGVDSVVWESSDTATATVDASGLVTAIANGKAYISSSDTSGNQKTEICVLVGGIDAATTATGSNTIPVGMETALVVLQDETAQLAAIPAPGNTTDDVIWTSSDASIVRVNQNGLVAAVSEGKAYITASNAAEDIQSTVCIWTQAVRPMVHIEGAISLKPNQELMLEALPLPSDTTDPIIWESSDDAIAEVESGKVTAVAEGSAYISCGDQSGTVQWRILVMVKEDGNIPDPGTSYSMTNLLKNPDFSQNWTATSGTVASAGGVGTVSNATASARNLQLYQSGFRFDAGHKYYLRSGFRTTAPGSDPYCQIGASQDGLLSQYATEDTWTRKSFVYDGDVVSGSVIRLIFSWSSVVSLAGQTFEVFEPVFIDLTDAFGAGQEPDAEWCHNNIPFFDGTTTITV